jgi:biopolymer transport protein ExbD
MKHKKFEGINIIPFVDIMLVLLAIVLTTSTLVEKRLIPVSLASSSSDMKIKQKNITITIKRDGEIFWEKTPLTKSQTITKIKELKKDDAVNINCDKDSRFENFVFILDSLKAQGLENIQIVTKSDD